jgi:DNA-directed RNA polymerase subunit RPC12/RpoP
MAKTKSESDPSVIRFRCSRCGATLKVSIRQANRYIDCPKCRNRTQVPANQRQADEEARDYEVNRLAYDVTGVCRSCGAKMSKKAVVCVKCGFDYRKGKTLEVVDKTKLPEDYPTWNKVFAALGCKDVTNGITEVIRAFAGPLVAAGLLFPIAFGVAWWYTEPGEPGPAWPFYAALGLFGLAMLVFGGALQQGLVETCGRGMYGRPISGGALPVAALYFLANFLIAFALPILLIFLLGLSISFEEKGAETRMGVLGGLPDVQVEVGVLAGIVAGLALVPLAAFYFLFAVGTFAAELSLNPVRVFGWIVKCGVDAAIWSGMLVGFLLLFAAVAVGGGFGLAALGLEGSPAAVSWIFFAVVVLLLFSYSCSALAYTVGQVIKRNL